MLFILNEEEMLSPFRLKMIVLYPELLLLLLLLYSRTNVLGHETPGCRTIILRRGGRTNQSKIAAIKMKDKLNLPTSLEIMYRVWIAGRITVDTTVSERGLIVCV
jgi:hypothetical protein